MYSLGIILFEMVSHFKTNSEKHIECMKLRKSGNVSEEFMNKNPILGELIDLMIKKDPSERAEIKEIRTS